MNNHDQDEPLSRKAYREAQERANARTQSRGDGLLHRVKRPAPPEAERATAAPGEGEVASREHEFQKSLTPEEKTTRLKRWLNKVIVVLIALIIIVYLILFFVG